MLAYLCRCEMYSPKQTHLAQLFPESRDIIEACKASDIPMAVASRSPTPATAKAFLKTLGESPSASTALHNKLRPSHVIEHGRKQYFLISELKNFSAGLWEGYFEPILIIPYVGKDQSHFPKVCNLRHVSYLGSRTTEI